MKLFSPSRLWRSFGHALRGLVVVFREEPNFRIHVIASLVSLLAAVYFRISFLELTVLILAISFLLVLEIINTGIEKIIDILKPRVHFYAGTIKDASAAAVLVGAIGALAVVIAIFLPYLLR